MVLEQPYDSYVVPVKWPRNIDWCQITTKSNTASCLDEQEHFILEFWDLLHKARIYSKWKSCKKYVASISICNHSWHDFSWLATTAGLFAQLWSDLIIKFHEIILCIFTSFRLWPLKSFVKWAPVLENVMKRYVTGCLHFRYPALETEYNSFASQSDKQNRWLLYWNVDSRLVDSQAYKGVHATDHHCTVALNRKCHIFDEFVATDCSGNCQNENQ